MKALKCSVLFCLFFTLLVPKAGYSWGANGHRIVAEIAEMNLSKKAKKELKNLIGNDGLAEWANWMDFIKSDPTWKFAEPWHYVDLPGHMEKDAFITGLKKLEGKTLYTQIPEMIQILKNKSNTQEERAKALRFLLHLMGDLHQPLHVGRDEDQGGNKITVFWFKEKTNLHRIWDETLIEFQKYSFTEYTKVITNNVPKNNTYAQGTLDDWFYDSHQASDIIYDNVKIDDQLSYRYNFDNVQLLETQLLKGGLRLAKVLNDIFG